MRRTARLISIGALGIASTLTGQEPQAARGPCDGEQRERMVHLVARCRFECLKQDSKLFSGLFVFPLIIAAVVIVSLIALFLYHYSYQRGML